MSLILDALRKSEAERRRGESPSLYSGLPTPSTRRRPAVLRHLPWIAAAVLALVALFVFRRDEAPATRQELSGDAPAAEAREPTAPDTGFETAAAVVAASPPPPRAQALPTTSAPAPSVDALVKPPPPAPSAPPTPPTASAIPLPPPVAAPAADSEADAEEALPPLAVLDTSTRTTLPALKLSMHFYSADPERRFAIVDGQRVVEGTQLGAAVVTQIRRDGVVLEVNGRRLLLPRP